MIAWAWPRAACSLPDLIRYFLWLGATGFGGPIALVGFMQRDLVEERHWFSDEEYRDGLALAQLAPGPLAAQLAMYLGWARGGALGAALVGLAFVVPSFVMVLALALAYLPLRRPRWMQGAFYGIGAAVIAIIARSAFKLTRLTLGRDVLLWGLFAVAALVTAWTESEIVWVFLGAGALAVLACGAIAAARETLPRPRSRPAAAGPLGGPLRSGARRDAVAHRLVLRRGRILRVRQRPRHRPVPPRRRVSGSSAGSASGSSWTRWRSR